MPRGAKAKPAETTARPYTHDGELQALRPDVGIQPEFERRSPRRPARRYRYDPGLDPQMSWDPQPARGQGEQLLAAILENTEVGRDGTGSARELKDAATRAHTAALELTAMSRAFLEWTGKAEGTDLEVLTLPLYVHERLSTKAVLESVSGMRRTPGTQMSLFADPQLDAADRVLRAYEHVAPWTNRLILGDSLLVMNSLLEYEGLGGKVQMVFMDPPYGVRFGSNFQPFVRKREVRANSDADLTREPEMVKAYRDTWELGLHSYLTFLRDRLSLCRDLLAQSGSIFVQISDQNLHHVREILDEVFGAENALGIIAFAKTSGATSELLPSVSDYLLWYARDRAEVKYHQLYLEKTAGGQGGSAYTRVELSDKTRRRMTAAEQADPALLPPGSRIYRLDNLTSQSVGRAKGEGAASWFPVELEGKTYRPTMQSRWKTNQAGMERLKAAGRLEATTGGGLYYVRYVDDFPVYALSSTWGDTGIAGFTADKLYVVETSAKVVQRCILMTTDPGDLVFDPTCGSGTTAYAAERWGRRWIAADVSRVPLALTRQRLLTATFPWYTLKDPGHGPAGGFVYTRHQDRNGRETGGVVPHVTLRSIAQEEDPAFEVLVDRPEIQDTTVRVSGPFTVEAVIAPALSPPSAEDGGLPEAGTEANAAPDVQRGRDRLLEALRRAPVLRLPGGDAVTFRAVRAPGDTLSLHAEGERGPQDRPERVAFTFGQESAAVSVPDVLEAAREAYGRGYKRLYVIGYAIDDAAGKLIREPRSGLPVPAVYVQATMDLQMGDLLRTNRASEVFAVVGAPDVRLRQVSDRAAAEPRYAVELLGVDTFDPQTMKTSHLGGSDVPAWMLDQDYDGMVFRASQVFFPRTGAWEGLRQSLRGIYRDEVWARLASAESEPFALGERGKVAVKVLDDRGNELLTTCSPEEAAP